jgi:hypothetical protein
VRYSSIHYTDVIDHANRVAARRALIGLAHRGLVVRLGTLGFDRSCRWHIGAWSFGHP